MDNKITQTALQGFRNRFKGKVITPGEPDYNQARKIFNAMIDKQPGLIAQCHNVEDVLAAVQFGRESGLEISIRGGGHGVAGRCLTDGGIVIDLRPMNSVSVNPDDLTVKVQGGATMSDLDRATEPFGLATTGGRVSTTGVGGYILGGGDGWLARYMGLACDNLISAEIVTADGSVITVSQDNHHDLFWALHGGGGNFGVATSFTLRLHELPVVTAGMFFWSPQEAPRVLSEYRNFMKTAPDNVGGGAVFLTGFDEGFVPEELVGNLTFTIFLFYAGTRQQALEVAAPLLELNPEGQMVQEMPYAEMNCLLDDPPGYRNYWSVEYLNEFPDEAVNKMCSRAGDMIVPSPSQHVIIPQGGAIERGPQGYPLPWRNAPWCVHPFGLWEDPAMDNKARQWAHDVRADLKPWASGDVYLNFVGEEGADRLLAGFGHENYKRLSEVKAKYDPENIFHLNHNIKPKQV